MAAAGVSLPAAGLHAAGARHLRGAGAAGRGQRPGGRSGEADAAQELLQLHPDHRRERDERGDGQSGWVISQGFVCGNLCWIFLFWSVGFTEDSGAVFICPGAENIERVVFTIIQGAVDFPDPIAQKTCFIILSKLVELWGEKVQRNVELWLLLLSCCCCCFLLSDDALIYPAGGKDGMVGFPDFIYKNIVPACFLAPLKPTFDLSDAQTVLVSFCTRLHPKNMWFWPFLTLRTTVVCFPDAVRVRCHTENDSPQTGKSGFTALM